MPSPYDVEAGNLGFEPRSPAVAVRREGWAVKDNLCRLGSVALTRSREGSQGSCFDSATRLSNFFGDGDRALNTDGA
jgi:hypothetical protein